MQGALTAATRSRPIGFYVNHLGSGHLNRCEAIIEYLARRPVTVFCAGSRPVCPDRPWVKVVALPDGHGTGSRTQALHRQPRSTTLDCAPLGVTPTRLSMGTMAAWTAAVDPALMVVDVSSEVNLLMRLCSVPVVQIRMHGERHDNAHIAAYSACSGFIAPFDERLEQDDWPEHFRSRTLYCGGIMRPHPQRSRAQARQRLELEPDHPLVIAISGGGPGIPLASISVGARTRPDSTWIVVGKSVRHGHETDFANVRVEGWVDDVSDYIAAADVVVAQAGDTLVHEIMRFGRPAVFVPEWCYFDEQQRKAAALASLGAGVHCPTWPASHEAWEHALQAAERIDPLLQRSLVDDRAPRRAARYIEGLVHELWRDEASNSRGQEALA